MKTLQASTFALMGIDASDATYTSCETKINQWVQTRNSLAQQMKTLFGRRGIRRPTRISERRNCAD
jgi:hypothetical protein